MYYQKTSGEHLVFKWSFCTDIHQNIHHSSVSSVNPWKWPLRCDSCDLLYLLMHGFGVLFCCFCAIVGSLRPGWPKFCLPRCIWLLLGLCRLLCTLCYNARWFYSQGKQRSGTHPLVLQIYLKFCCLLGTLTRKRGGKPQSWGLAVFQIFNLSLDFSLSPSQRIF